MLKSKYYLVNDYGSSDDASGTLRIQSDFLVENNHGRCAPTIKLSNY